MKIHEPGYLDVVSVQYDLLQFINKYLIIIFIISNRDRRSAVVISKKKEGKTKDSFKRL